jgi:DNA polymerase-3 subunit delta'
MKKILHACILSGGDAAALEEKAYALAADVLCDSPRNGAACGSCRHCRKVKGRIHPDITLIERELNKEGKLRKEIVVDQVRRMEADAAILPNEAERKVYILREAETLNTEGQNAFLKLLEEPPEWVRFFLCAKNAAALLPTIRSRCVEMHVTGAEQDASEGAETLCRVLTEGREAVLRHLISLENSRMKREELLETVDGAWYLTAEALLTSGGKPVENETAALLARSFEVADLNRLNGIFEDYRGQCRYNVNVGMVLGAMAAELRRILRK